MLIFCPILWSIWFFNVFHFLDYQSNLCNAIVHHNGGIRFRALFNQRNHRFLTSLFIINLKRHKTPSHIASLTFNAHAHTLSDSGKVCLPQPAKRNPNPSFRATRDSWRYCYVDDLRSAAREGHPVCECKAFYTPRRPGINIHSVFLPGYGDRSKQNRVDANSAQLDLPNGSPKADLVSRIQYSVAAMAKRKKKQNQLRPGTGVLWVVRNFKTHRISQSSSSRSASHQVCASVVKQI